MRTFTVTYTVRYQLKDNSNYVWNNYNECYNLKTGRRLKQVLKNGTIGYIINNKFFSLKKLRSLLIKPIKENNPF